MTLRTPRRRISPQTKRRYRAIKGFFRRALGSSSQPDLQITSSIAVNVTDIKHKIIGLEQQLNEVSKQCRHITSLEDTLRKESQSIVSDLRDEASHEDLPTGSQLNGVETELLYKQAKENDYEPKTDNESTKLHSINKMNSFYDEKIPKLIKTNRANDSDINPNYRQHKTKSVYQNFFSAYSTSSFHSLNQYREMFHSNLGYSGDDNERGNRGKVQNNQHKDTKYREHLKKTNLDSYRQHYEQGEAQITKNRKSKRTLKELDQDFIADIIKRQYKPVKFFGRRESALSQFSAPVCRDHQFYQTGSYHVEEEPQQCLCCCGGPRYKRRAHHSDHSDLRSVCDARLYSVKRNARKHRKKYADVYNDSEIYDLVPVKEKSSPRSRRKFYEENMRCSAHYREVPPSPRSHRPRLNLKAQHYVGSDDNTDFVKNTRKRISPKRAMRAQEPDNHEDNCQPSEIQQMEKPKHLQNLTKSQDPMDIHRGMGTMSSLQYPAFDTEENTPKVETPLNKTQETVSSADKTDKALCEIKDILQIFLQEIKKEASLHSGKLEETNENCNSPPKDVRARPNSGHSFHYKPVQFPVSPTPYMQPFGNNTCCCPMMPVYPMNCMQNGYPVPSTSFICNNCTSPKSNEINCNDNVINNDAANEMLNCETDELVKEIYKFVSKSPKYCRRESISKEGTRRADSTVETKVLTSRSAGGNTRVRRRDKKVGTPKMTGVSKSCEAIRSKTLSYASSSDTSTSYSDTLLDKLSLEATQSASPRELSETDKAKMTTFAKVLKSLGLRKKNQKDAIEELSESETTIDVDVKKKKPPFRQNITNYTVHDQEYYNRPPLVSPHYRREHRPPYNPDDAYNQFYSHRMQQSTNERPHQPQYHHGQGPTAPPYPHSYEGYNQMHPQVPLCLKEIEVKSIGCQSERKMSFFKKMTQRAQQEAMRGDDPKNCSTQTAQNKPKLLSWKNTETKLLDRQANAYAYGYETQKKLAEGDTKMRKAMLKKLFHKRNPFSPGNLILRTLLGRDKSSFGNPPAMYKPRLFL